MPSALHEEMNTNTKASLFPSPSPGLYKPPLSHLRQERGGRRHPSFAMADMLQYLWDRARGRWHVRIICNKIFNDIADKEKRSLSLNDLHVATLRVYNSANKQFLSPHKEPPSVVDVADKIEAYHSQGIEAITLEEFYRLIMEWIRKDLHIVFANKVLAASLGAPALAAITKNAGRQLPRIKDVSEKIPTSLLFTIYFVGVILL